MPSWGGPPARRLRPGRKPSNRNTSLRSLNGSGSSGKCGRSKRRLNRALLDKAARKSLCSKSSRRSGRGSGNGCAILTLTWAAVFSPIAMLGVHDGAGIVEELEVSISRRVHDFTAFVGTAAVAIEKGVEGTSSTAAAVSSVVRVTEEKIVDVVAQLPKAFDLGDEESRSLFVSALRIMKEDLLQKVASHLDIDDKVRRIFVAIDLAAASLIGMVEDGVVLRGFDVINDIEFRDWLRKHGASEKYSVSSAPIVGLYD